MARKKLSGGTNRIINLTIFNRIVLTKPRESEPCSVAVSKL